MNPALRAAVQKARGPAILGQDGKPMASAYVAGSHTHEDLRRWMPYPGSANSDLLSELGTIRSRTRDIDRNHGVAGGAAQTNVDNVVGTGLRLKSRPNWKALGWTEEKAEEWSNIVEARWSAYAESTWFDAARTVNFDFGTRLIFRSAFNNGEALALPLWLPEPGAPAATRFQIVEPDRLCNPNHQPDREGMLGGKELDGYGAPVAYHIAKSHPGDRYSYTSGFCTDTVRVPAFTDWGRPRVLHAFDQTRPGQSRGVPALASVLRQFKVLADYSHAELKAAVVNAMVSLVTESALGQEQLVELLGNNTDALTKYQEGLTQRDRAGIDFSGGGMIMPLQLGEKIASFSPARPNDSFEPFVLALFRQIAAGLNIPYELLLKDFSQTNYSSARAALLEAWRFFKHRRKWLATFWAKPVFELWFEEEANEGRIEAPDYYEKRALYCRAKWIGDGRGWIDPLKEAQAAELRMQTGITTLEDECAEQGTDWEETIEVRARIEKRAREAGVVLPGMAEYNYSAPITEREIQPGEEPSTQPANKPAKTPGTGNAGRAPTIQNHVEVVPESVAAALNAATAQNSQAVIALVEQIKQSNSQIAESISQQVKEAQAEIIRQGQAEAAVTESQSGDIKTLAAIMQRESESSREAAVRQGALIMALAESIKELGKATERGLQAVAQTSLMPTRAVIRNGEVIGTVKVASLDQE